VKKIATLLNITRIWNSVCAVSLMRRALTIAQEYAPLRVAFGQPLSRQPLHVETLAELETEVTAGLLLVMRVAELLGRDETGCASKAESALVRLLTPLTKLYTGKQSVATVSECLECLGGVGYCEDSGLPRLLRDSQTLCIWEGTTNVLSLDALRAIEKESALKPYFDDTRNLIDGIAREELKPMQDSVMNSIRELEAFFDSVSLESREWLETRARRVAYSLTRTYMGALLISHTDWALRLGQPSARLSLAAAGRWCVEGRYHPLCVL
jgi:hypothetical protein